MGDNLPVPDPDGAVRVITGPSRSLRAPSKDASLPARGWPEGPLGRLQSLNDPSIKGMPCLGPPLKFMSCHVGCIDKYSIKYRSRSAC